MGVALMLVLVVMRQARQPALYETFFGDPKGQWQPVQANHPASAKNKLAVQKSGVLAFAGQTQRPAEQTEEKEIAPAESARLAVTQQWEQADEWVAELPVDLQRSWIKTLLMIENGSVLREQLISTEDLAKSREVLANLASATETVTEEFGMIEELIAGDETEFRLSWETVSWWASPALAALDKAALSRVADGTFWSGADSDAFYMQLVRATQLPTDQGVTAGTLQLLQQPKVYQGQSLRMIGAMGLAEKVAAKENDYGVKQYWKLWMIPSDGGIRPILLICRELPSEVSDHLMPDGKWNRRSNPNNPKGEFAAVGRFIKRLPYRSSVGADLAPAVIGKIVATRGGASTAASQSNAPSDRAADQVAAEQALTNRWRMVGLFAAMALGITIAAGLMYRTSIDAKRSRRLRNQSISLPFPNPDSPTATQNDS